MYAWWLVLTYLLAYWLTPWSRVLLEKLISYQLVKKFPAFYRTQKFITTFTSACHLSITSARLIQPMPSHPTSWRSILILSSCLCLGLPSNPYSAGFPTKTLNTSLLSTVHPTSHTPLILLNLITPTIFGEEYRSLSSSLRRIHHFPVTLSLWGPNMTDNKVRELITAKVLQTSLLNTTVVAFKALPLGSYAPMPAPSPPFKTILKLVLWNGLQSCRCITPDDINVIKMPSFQYFLYLQEQKKVIGG